MFTAPDAFASLSRSAGPFAGREAAGESSEVQENSSGFVSLCEGNRMMEESIPPCSAGSESQDGALERR
jgi:hypothetical protein